MKSKNIRVAIWMVTYNHENYIQKSIESVLMQQTDFDIMLYIGEDKSSDNTAIICENYANKFPNKITLLQSEFNIGAEMNGLRVYKACLSSGADYVALLEGDDYWTDPFKLQKQVEILDSNNKYSGSFHQTYVINHLINEDGKRCYRENLKESYSAEDTLSFNSIFHTSSFVFRREAYTIELLQSNVVSGDMALFSIVAKYGDLIRVEGVMSVYRKMETGLSSSTRVTYNYFLDRISLLCYLNAYHDYRFTNILREKISILIEESISLNQGKSVNFVAKTISAKVLFKALFRKIRNYLKF